MPRRGHERRRAAGQRAAAGVEALGQQGAAADVQQRSSRRPSRGRRWCRDRAWRPVADESHHPPAVVANRRCRRSRRGRAPATRARVARLQRRGRRRGSRRAGRVSVPAAGGANTSEPSSSHAATPGSSAPVREHRARRPSAQRQFLEAAGGDEEQRRRVGTPGRMPCAASVPASADARSPSTRRCHSCERPFDGGDEGDDVAGGGDGGVEASSPAPSSAPGGAVERHPHDGGGGGARLAVPLHQRPREQRHQHEERRRWRRAFRARL